MTNQPQIQQVDPLTGMPAQQALPTQPQAQVPPQASNELGSAKPVFNPNSTAIADQVFGNAQQRANSVSTEFQAGNQQQQIV